MPSENDIARAAECLRGGGLVIFPTETVYGVGANAYDVNAVAKVFAVKGRPHFDPLIVHIAETSWLRDLVAAVPEAASALMRRFWPGPLTFVLPKTSRVPDLVTAGLPTVAVRMPRHELALALIRAAGVPVAAPSANRFGHLSSSTAEAARAELGDRVNMILDGGPCPVGVESTILSFAEGRAILLRPGGLRLEEIESVIGPVEVAPPVSSTPESPGRLSRHYAPRVPLTLIRRPAEVTARENAGLLLPIPMPDVQNFAAVEILSDDGSDEKAAARFFSALRRLEASGVQRIYAVPGPEYGLWRAINDRLRRGSGSLAEP